MFNKKGKLCNIFTFFNRFIAQFFSFFSKLPYKLNKKYIDLKRPLNEGKDHFAAEEAYLEDMTDNDNDDTIND